MKETESPVGVISAGPATDMPARLGVCVRACVRACMRARVRACV